MKEKNTVITTTSDSIDRLVERHHSTANTALIISIARVKWRKKFSWQPARCSPVSYRPTAQFNSMEICAV